MARQRLYVINADQWTEHMLTNDTLCPRIHISLGAAKIQKRGSATNISSSSYAQEN